MSEPSPTFPCEPWSLDDWAHRYITTTDLAIKCAPGPAPSTFRAGSREAPAAPGRPKELQITTAKPRSLKPGSLIHARSRAELNHKFWHHELQAAELFLWAVLRFSDAEPEFRRGLIKIFYDEVRHMSFYETRILHDGFRLGSFPIRDWFWERMPSCQTKVQFVALMGMGLEAANLEHTARFAQWFKSAGDEKSAQVQEQVGLEEVAHVRFANRWFEQWSGGISFAAWKAALPPPLSPLLMRGKTLAVERRLKAQFPAPFIDELAAWQPEDN